MKKHPFTIRTASMHNVNLRGIMVPYGALYGWNEDGIAWYIKEYPHTKNDHITIYVDDNGKTWHKAYFKKYRSIYGHVYDYITRNNLYGKKTNPCWYLHGTFESGYSYGKKQKTEGFKTANKKYYERGDGMGTIYNGMLYYDPIHDRPAKLME